MSRLELALAKQLLAFKETLDAGTDPDQALAEAAAALLELIGNPLDKGSPPISPARYRMPNDRVSRTGKLTIHPDGGGEPREYYCILGYYDDGRLGELFVRHAKEGGTLGAMMDAVATAVSIGLQHGIPWQVYADKFQHQRFPPSGPTDDASPELRFVSSPLDYLARWVNLRLDGLEIGKMIGVDAEGANRGVSKSKAPATGGDTPDDENDD